MKKPSASSEKLGEVTITRQELWVMLICMVRYALGRSTYVVQEACDHVEKYVKYLSSDQKLQILNEISQAINRAEEDEKLLGARYDHDCWISLLRRVNSQ